MERRNQYSIDDPTEGRYDDQTVEIYLEGGAVLLHLNEDMSGGGEVVAMSARDAGELAQLLVEAANNLIDKEAKTPPPATGAKT